MEGQYMIYGAYGYTGELIAREAVARGHRPILAGRDPVKVPALAQELGCEYNVFKLEDARIIDEALDGVNAVLHCAGPFLHTYRPMVKACLRTGTHYLDITGEAGVFEAAAALDPDAREAEVMLLPGAGFDVVPTDCLALHLKQRLPSAKRLALGVRALGRLSRGTATTMIENLHRGGLVRSDGHLTAVPTAWKTREIDFGDGPRTSVSMPWGDVATAYHSTGIPNIEVYFALPAKQRRMLRWSRAFKPILALGPIQGWLKGRVRKGPAGPSEEERQRGKSLLWGQVEDAEGQTATTRLETPEGYTVTYLAALAIVQRVLSGDAPVGFQTPAKAYGADLILELDGVRRTDVDVH